MKRRQRPFCLLLGALLMGCSATPEQLAAFKDEQARRLDRRLEQLARETTAQEQSAREEIRSLMQTLRERTYRDLNESLTKLAATSALVQEAVSDGDQALEPQMAAAENVGEETSASAAKGEELIARIRRGLQESAAEVEVAMQERFGELEESLKRQVAEKAKVLLAIEAAQLEAARKLAQAEQKAKELLSGTTQDLSTLETYCRKEVELVRKRRGVVKEETDLADKTLSEMDEEQDWEPEPEADRGAGRE